jgi:hypothetical protein
MFGVIATKSGHHGDFPFPDMIHHHNGNARIAVDEAACQSDVIVQMRPDSLKSVYVSQLLIVTPKIGIDDRKKAGLLQPARSVLSIRSAKGTW